MISLLRTTALVLAITVMAGPALAAEVQLPLELAWCEAREAVEAKLSSPSELTDGVVESEAKAFGARGTITAVFEDGLLLSVRFRVFETEDVYRKVKEELTRIHGEGQLKDRTKEGMARNLTITWEVDAEQTLQLKVSSEQLYVLWEVWPSHCIAAEAARVGLSDAEQADLDASTKKKAIDFDPLAEDIEDVDERKKTADDAKKSEAEAEEDKRKEEEPPPADVEIDW